MNISQRTLRGEMINETESSVLIHKCQHSLSLQQMAERAEKAKTLRKRGIIMFGTG